MKFGDRVNVKLGKIGDTKSWTLQVRFFAAGTSTGPGKTLTFFKNVSAQKTLGGANRQFFTLDRQRLRNVGKVCNHLSFLDANLPGYLPRIHLLEG